MEPATSNSQTWRVLVCIRPRLRNRGSPAARDKGAKMAASSNVVSPETETNQRAPLIAGISAQGGNSPVARDCVVELVGLEPTTSVLWNMVRVRPAHLVGHQIPTAASPR